MKDTYVKALKDAEAELKRLTDQRMVLDVQILKLKQTVEALSALCEVPVPDMQSSSTVQLEEGAGITEAIRKVLSAYEPMKAPQIRDALEGAGFDVSSANILNIIHNTIRRMMAQGEVTQVMTRSGTFMGWIYRPKQTVSLTTREQLAQYKLAADRFEEAAKSAMEDGKKKRRLGEALRKRMEQV